MEQHRDFERLCERNWSLVFRTAYLITGDRHDAADLAQEAFARAFEHWSSVSMLERPEAWLQRVVANLGVSWIRRKAVRRRTSLPRQRDEWIPDPLDARLIKGLRKLSPAQRSAVVLRFFADWSIEDVANALGKRPGTIRSLTAQGVARLRVLLPADFEEVKDEDPR